MNGQKFEYSGCVFTAQYTLMKIKIEDDVFTTGEPLQIASADVNNFPMTFVDYRNFFYVKPKQLMGRFPVFSVNGEVFVLVNAYLIGDENAPFARYAPAFYGHTFAEEDESIDADSFGAFEYIVEA